MMSAPASHEDRAAAGAYGPWHPGLESELPRELLPLATVFRRENVSTSVAEAFELSDYCGLPPQELVAFRPERLNIHELLVRVTAGLSARVRRLVVVAVATDEPDGTKGGAAEHHEARRDECHVTDVGHVDVADSLSDRLSLSHGGLRERGRGEVMLCDTSSSHKRFIACTARRRR